MVKLKGSILVIDDDPLILMNYVDILDDAGYMPIEASSYIQGWNAAQGRTFELIICDHDLGDGKGIDLLSKMIAAGIATPVIYLSAAQSKVLAEVAKLSTVMKVLTKPVSQELLLSTVNDFISAPKGDKYPRLIGKEERDQLLRSFSIDNENEQ